MNDSSRLSVLSTLVFGGCLAFATPSLASGPVIPCSTLAGLAVPDGTINTAVLVPPAGGLGEYCEVSGTISPEAGSNIVVVVRLPTDWNGKVLGVGSGGWAGNITLNAARTGLLRGYATFQTDSGHPSPNGLDFTWSLIAPGELNEPAVTDFGYRAHHLLALAGKGVVLAYYGQPQSHAYFQGCSTGGRQGFAEVQRYPLDYDGVITGAPVFSTVVQTSSIFRTQIFHLDPESNLLPAHVPLIANAVVAACDAQDGVEDGILDDPRRCKWDPGAVQCSDASDGTDPTCLSEKQVETVRKNYEGLTLPDGTLVANPITRGSEPDWLGRSVGSPFFPLGLNAVLGGPFFTYMVKLDPTFNLLDFDPEVDMPAVRDAFATHAIEQTNPDITPFIQSGGKLLIWHGFDDPGPSPLQTIAYYEDVLETVAKNLVPGTTQKKEQVEDSVRLFLLPGVFHCGGGPGTSSFDGLTPMEQWVEQGIPPDRIIATNAARGISRPLCPYPEVARWTGSGSTDDAANFVCVGGHGKGAGHSEGK